MFRKIVKAFMIIAIVILITTGLLVGFALLVTNISAAGKIMDADEAPSKKVAIVFGAGLQHDGRPTAVLQDRVAAAAELYFAGKVEIILMSGDNRFVDYNEPGAMRAYAIELGVPDEAVVLDYAGRRTYDTCYRAKAIFGVKDALLVTQKFHLPRTLFICRSLGINSIGVIADRRVYRSYALTYWRLREIPAQIVALYDVWIRHPLPVMGPFEPIE
ncbi:MAG: ElyC/SanA/YdcF family protein [Anaerolineaceae bacterium]